MPYFGEPVGRVKIQTTREIYYPTRQIGMFARANSDVDIYLPGMRDRSMRSGTDLAREIKLIDWSMAGNLSNRSSGVQIPRAICTRLKRYLYSAKCSWIIVMKRKANEHDERRHGEDIKGLNQGLDIFFRRTVNEVKLCNRCMRESFKPSFRETHPKISRDARFVQAVVVCAIEKGSPAIKSYTVDGEE